MDVVDAWTDFVRVVVCSERAQQFHLRTRHFDGDHVSVHLYNGFNDVLKFRRLTQFSAEHF